VGFFVYRHLGLLECNIVLMERFLPLLMLTGLLFGQDTTIVLENGSTVSGTIISETDSTYRIMSESWRVTDGVYEVFNTFINISKNETEGEAADIVAKEEVEKQARVDAKEDFGLNVMLWGVTGLSLFFQFPLLGFFQLNCQRIDKKHCYH